MSLTDVQLHLVETFEDAQAFMRWLGERHTHDAIAVDTETGGLEWWRQPLRLVQFGDMTHGWAMAWDDWAGLVRQVMREYDGHFILHNSKFDRHFFKQQGIDVQVSRVQDTMLMAHVINPVSSIGLKNLATRLIHPAAKEGERQMKQAMRSAGWKFDTVPITFGPYWQYGALDTVLTAHLYDKFVPQVRGSFSDIYDLELAVSDVLWRMEQNGARIDLGYVNKKHQEMDEYSKRLRAWAFEQYGVENATSNQQVIDRLLQDGVTLTKKTKKGNISLDKEVLESLHGVHPLADAVLNIRNTEKLANTYFKNFEEMADGEYLHPSIRQVGARTGRMSVSAPALQTLPRGSIVRDAFIPHDDNSLLLIDYSQVEMRVFAHFANEQGMIDAIRNGVDLHTFVCRELYDIPEDQEPPREKRQITKNANFAKVYVAGVNTFAKTAGIEVGEAKKFLDMYDERFPGVRRFHQTVEDTAMTRYTKEGAAYITTPYGRRHPCDPDKLYKLVNYLIQGTCADLLKDKLVQLDAAGLGEYMILPVHDEVIFDVPTAEVEEVKKTAEEIMHEEEKFSVPLGVDGKIVRRWGDAYR